MKQRKWDSKTKANAVLDGIRGCKVAEICNEYQISQTQYYQWRDQLLSNLDKPFETTRKANIHLSLERENRELKMLIGELSLELKKSEEELG